MENTPPFKIRIGAIAGLLSLTVLGNAHAGNLQGTYQKMLGLVNNMQQDAGAQLLSNTYAGKLTANFTQLQNNLKRGLGLSRKVNLSAKSDGVSLLIEVAAVAASTGAIHEFSSEAQNNIVDEMHHISGTLSDEELMADVDDILDALEGRKPARAHMPRARRATQLRGGSQPAVNNYRTASSTRVRTSSYQPVHAGLDTISKNAQLHKELSRGISTKSPASKAASTVPAASNGSLPAATLSSGASMRTIASRTISPTEIDKASVPAPMTNAGASDASAPVTLQPAARVSNPEAKARWGRDLKGVKEARSAEANKLVEQDTSGTKTDFERIEKDHDEDAAHREALKAAHRAKIAAVAQAKAKAAAAEFTIGSADSSTAIVPYAGSSVTPTIVPSSAAVKKTMTAAQRNALVAALNASKASTTSSPGSTVTAPNKSMLAIEDKPAESKPAVVAPSRKTFNAGDSTDTSVTVPSTTGAQAQLKKLDKDGKQSFGPIKVRRGNNTRS